MGSERVGRVVCSPQPQLGSDEGDKAFPLSHKPNS